MGTTRTVVIVGARHRGWSREVNHQALIESIIAPRKEFYGQTLSVSSIGCDVGFGKATKEYCEEQGVKFFEFVVYFNGPRSKEEYTYAYLARHAALMEVGDEFHITVSQTRQSTVEDLVERVRASGKLYVLYDELNNVLEFYDPEATATNEEATQAEELSA